MIILDWQLYPNPVNDFLSAAYLILFILLIT
jgi:hypothetical protein